MNACLVLCRLVLPLMLWSTAGARAEPLVALDVGHGLVDQGAVSARGRGEFFFNRDLAMLLAAALRQAGMAVREVNFSGDVTVLAERPMIAAGSDFFLSLHHDSVNEAYLEFWDRDGIELSYTTAKRGFGLFVSRANPDPERGLRCASALGAALRGAGFIPTSWHGRRHEPADADNGVWYYDNLVVLYRTGLPAVLFEAGVIKHRDEELELLDPARQDLMVHALAGGLAACLSVREKPAPA